MMQPLTLEEFAQNLRVSGDYREMEFADEILMLLDIEAEVAEPYSDLCAELEHHAPDKLKDEPAKMVEWLGDRSAMLEEIEKQLSDEGLDVGANGLPIDAADAVKELLGTLGDAEDILEEHGWSSGDFLSALGKLAEAIPTPLCG